MSETFKKDAGKLRLGLIDPVAMVDLGTILTAGAIKYAPNGWRKGIGIEDGEERLIEALERHLNAVKRGEVFDKELGVPHIAQVMCNAMFLTWFVRERHACNDVDAEPWSLPLGSFRHPLTREVVDLFALPEDLKAKLNSPRPTVAEAELKYSP